jgi:hypothetical protein
MTTLYFTNCKKCNTMYLVGVDGKDIRGSTTSGGNMHLAIGNDEIEKAPKVPKSCPCKKCGMICKVQKIKPKRVI